MTKVLNRYTAIIEAIFEQRYRPDAQQVSFSRQDIIDAAGKLGIALPKNVGDVLYSFRYRADLPDSITKYAPDGFEWVIRSVGKGQYQFALSANAQILPSRLLAETKVLDATPGIITRYAIGDEQGLLARLRYNRLIGTFTGVTCYSLQNHLRTFVKGIGQVETDELYVGVDRRGAHYVLPVQAKGGTDKLGIIQIEQDIAMCEQKFRGAICRPIAAQFIDSSSVALFVFEQTDNGVRITAERHYRLVESANLEPDELASYRTRPE